MTLAYPLAWPTDPGRNRPFLPKELDLNLASLSKSGGQSLSGIEQVVASPAMRWEGKFTMPSMMPAAVLAWRGFIAAMQGRIGTVLLPAFEYGRQPWPNDQFGRVISPDVDPAGAIIIITAAPAALNATSLVLTPVAPAPYVPGAILPGHRFSIGGTLYEVQQALADGIGNYVVAIRPWLRVALAVDTACEFANPVCQVRFKTDDEGALRFTSHRTASPIFSVVEAF
jgi:hypothetical protein